MDHLIALYEFFTRAGLFSAGMVAGLAVPFITASVLRRWLYKKPRLTRAASIVAPLPALAFVVLLFWAPPAAGGWDFVIGAILFALFSLPAWLVLFAIAWLVLVVKPWFWRPPAPTRTAEVDTTATHAGKYVSQRAGSAYASRFPRASA